MFVLKMCILRRAFKWIDSSPLKGSTQGIHRGSTQGIHSGSTTIFHILLFCVHFGFWCRLRWSGLRGPENRAVACRPWCCKCAECELEEGAYQTSTLIKDGGPDSLISAQPRQFLCRPCVAARSGLLRVRLARTVEGACTPTPVSHQAQPSQAS